MPQADADHAAMHSQGGSTFLREMLSIHLKNNPAKFHPDLIWNDGALSFFCRASPQQKQQQQQGE